jgi:hypothetical protein
MNNDELLAALTQIEAMNPIAGLVVWERPGDRGEASLFKAGLSPETADKARAHADAHALTLARELAPRLIREVLELRKKVGER